MKSNEERMIEVGPGIEIWAESFGNPDDPTLLLIMGANGSGKLWPDSLIEPLAGRFHVIRFDLRDTGKSSWAFDENPYDIADLADDAIAVLDSYGVDKAHLVGVSMGGLLTQLLLIGQPDRILTATMFGAPVLEVVPEDPEQSALPGPSDTLLEFWNTMGDERDREEELDWRVRHMELLNNGGRPMDLEVLRASEARVMDHAGRVDGGTAHARAGQGGLDRGAELRDVDVPVLVIDAPKDPIAPPPNPAYLAGLIPGAEMVTIEDMGHAITEELGGDIAGAVLDFIPE